MPSYKYHPIYPENVKKRGGKKIHVRKKDSDELLEHVDFAFGPQLRASRLSKAKKEQKSRGKYEDYDYYLDTQSSAGADLSNSEKPFREHLEENQRDILTQLVRTGGDFSKIWQDFENRNISSQFGSLRYALLEEGTEFDYNDYPVTPTSSKPSWKNFMKSRPQTTASTSTSAAVIKTRSSTSSKSTTAPSTEAVRRERPSTSTSQGRSTSSIPQSTTSNPGGNYISHVFAIRGKLVTSKGNAFQGYTNWFGDEAQIRQRRPKRGGKDSKEGFMREVDLSGFRDSDVRMKLYDNHKLVIEGYRPSRGSVPPLRHKSIITLPPGISVDRLLMYRSTKGKLVIQRR